VPIEFEPFSGANSGIGFKRDSTELAKGSADMLDALAVLLGEHPYVRVQVKAFVKRGGEDAGKAQATLIQQYLTGKGVAAERVGAAGAVDAKRRVELTFSIAP
jgi:outer membrane protein OmpA-like peptidoglycan-associated protein